MNSLQNHYKICPHCSYPYNLENFTKCQVCQSPLDNNNNQTTSEIQDDKPVLSKPKITKVLMTQSQRKKAVNKWNKEILKPQNISGIIVIIGSIYLLLNHSFVNSNNAGAKVTSTPKLESVNTPRIKLVKAIKDVKNVPNGIFSYSGDGYFAALLKAGLVTEIVTAFPDFASRYTSPSNQDPSYSVAIEMLLKGDIDFVFNARPLSPTEYESAKLQNIQLQENAIALDGIVFYTHPDLTVSKITISQLVSVFRGEITNWKQLGGQDLAITPVILSKENVESLGFEVGDRGNIQYAPNHTLAVREVINTPGAIGYASASLVQNQSLLKFLTLGQSSVINPEIVNYVAPFLSNGELNHQAINKGTYPLVRRLALVNSDRPNSQAAGTAVSNFILSNQGQAIVDDAGFVSLRNQN